MKLFAILKLKAIQKKKNKCKGRIKTVNFEKKDIDLHFLYISVEKCLKMKESYISFLLLATRKCNLHIVQTIKWYKVKKKTTVTGKMYVFLFCVQKYRWGSTLLVI